MNELEKAWLHLGPYTRLSLRTIYIADRDGTPWPPIGHSARQLLKLGYIAKTKIGHKLTEAGRDLVIANLDCEYDKFWMEGNG